MSFPTIPEYESDPGVQLLLLTAGLLPLAALYEPPAIPPAYLNADLSGLHSQAETLRNAIESGRDAISTLSDLLNRRALGLAPLADVGRNLIRLNPDERRELDALEDSLQHTFQDIDEAALQLSAYQITTVLDLPVWQRRRQTLAGLLADALQANCYDDLRRQLDFALSNAHDLTDLLLNAAAQAPASPAPARKRSLPLPEVEDWQALPLALLLLSVVILAKIDGAMQRLSASPFPGDEQARRWIENPRAINGWLEAFHNLVLEVEQGHNLHQDLLMQTGAAQTPMLPLDGSSVRLDARQANAYRRLRDRLLALNATLTSFLAPVPSGILDDAADRQRLMAAAPTLRAALTFDRPSEPYGERGDKLSAAFLAAHNLLHALRR